MVVFYSKIISSKTLEAIYSRDKNVDYMLYSKSSENIIDFVSNRPIEELLFVTYCYLLGLVDKARLSTTIRPTSVQARACGH